MRALPRTREWEQEPEHGLRLLRAQRRRLGRGRDQVRLRPRDWTQLRVAGKCSAQHSDSLTDDDVPPPPKKHDYPQDCLRGRDGGRYLMHTQGTR